MPAATALIRHSLSGCSSGNCRCLSALMAMCTSGSSASESTSSYRCARAASSVAWPPWRTERRAGGAGSLCDCQTSRASRSCSCDAGSQESSSLPKPDQRTLYSTCPLRLRSATMLSTTHSSTSASGSSLDSEGAALPCPPEPALYSRSAVPRRHRWKEVTRNRRSRRSPRPS